MPRRLPWIAHSIHQQSRQVKSGQTAGQGWWLLGLGHNASKTRGGYPTSPHLVYVPRARPALVLVRAVLQSSLAHKKNH